MFVVLKTATGDGWWTWVSMPNDVTGVGDAIFRLRTDLARSWPTELAAIVVLLVVSAAILERRVQGVEVVT
jgi:hypothetical protein